MNIPEDLQALRANFIDREMVRVLAEKDSGLKFNSEDRYKGDTKVLINDFNNRFIIKPIKATIPAYYN